MQRSGCTGNRLGATRLLLPVGRADEHQGPRCLSGLVGSDNTATILHEFLAGTPNPTARAAPALLSPCFSPQLSLWSWWDARATSPRSSSRSRSRRSSNMASSSPLSAPGTASPLSSDEDTTRALSPSFEHAHTMATQASEVEGMTKPNAPATLAVKTASADEAVDKASKGKEKAAKGPLKLLDLPVDVLKEIIHQVGTQSAAPVLRNAAHRIAPLPWALGFRPTRPTLTTL
jgi:hypothetical protein